MSDCKNREMISHRANRLLTTLVVAVVAQHCRCFSTVQVKKTPAQLAMPEVTCFSGRIRAVFGPQVKSNIHIRDMTGAVIPVLKSDESCGVSLGRGKNQNLSFLSRYDSCYARIKGSKVVIPLQVQLTGEGRWLRVNISCPLIKRRRERTRLTPTPLPGNCDTERALQLACGPRSISSDACYELGCCYDARASTCYYRPNACSLDGHLVFSVKSTDTDPPIDPSSLTVKGQPQCSPAATTPDTAIFKIGVMDCGAKMKVERDVKIYEVEVEEPHTENTTKHSPFSVQVRCEYDLTHVKRAADLRSFFPVTNPPPAIALGTMRVQMRIAQDASFTSFFPEDQLPITFPLGEAVYVEISITQPSPDPTLSLRIRDCFAYPASRHSAWMLLHDGCPNPLDNMRSSVPVGDQGKTTSHSQFRRFNVKTFAFLDPHTGHPSVEEMYFYCWVEICTNDVECAQPCAIVSSEGERRRREATSWSDQVQLVSLGPLLLGQNSTELEDDQCVKQNAMFQVTAFILSGVGAALVLILVFTLWSSGRRQKHRKLLKLTNYLNKT
ncbi:zona pellucida sperm-binding protein 4-like [Anarrhichthys ocellatus]|uniref:zona pellucida sperm-binding protein 4-like n=1 Tax=Anarrhichthys ocellatus TaxID=433405 RepID=UPI0012EE892B|nr:zona pellucida sperm-binding protein 4-like [Anarrhichthys ocellatus]